MRLATVRTPEGSAAVAVDGRRGAVVARGDGGGAYGDVGALLRAGDAGLADARAALGRPERRLLSDHDLLPPILDPEAVVCVGLNYRSHIEEMGRDLPRHPTLFSKLPRSLCAPYADIVLPAFAEKVDYEGELAVVIGTGGRDIRVEDAWSAVAGLCVLNDVTVRDFQRRTPQWFAGKSWEASTPMGPFLVTPDEIADVGDLELVVKVNGEERQRATLDDLVFDVAALVSDLSRIVALRPGDILATGTPGGVGDAMRPSRYLEDGDVVTVSVSGLGTLSNRFRRAH